MLEAIHSPADLKGLTIPEMQALAAEIRQALIDTVAHTGGHLAPNLGAVELTLALHRVLDTPTDKIIFDVGHQSYTHKMITGRGDRLDTIRCEGGLSGFPKRAESPHDVFETGHASTALSAAVGMARARDLQGGDFAIAALVGDGALTGGMCYEALNDAGSNPTQLIMLLNDNEMSIAKNVGAMSKHLTRLRGSKHWIDAKHSVKRGLNRVPVIGRPMAGALEWIKRTARTMLVPGQFFEAMGFAYLGPIDGHDIETLERVLADARAMNLPVVVHAVTQKGRGYALAERQPERFHGVAPFYVDSGKTRTKRKGLADLHSAAAIAGEALEALAEKDARIVAITAAMAQGTGLEGFSEKFPTRFFDVGIAEEHAMTLAAGMASGGLRPVFGVYASFLQRAMDQLLHDVCLQKLPVTVMVDHAGFVPGDGATHQGVYDLAMLRAMPNLRIYAPCDARDLQDMLAVAVASDLPCVIRYPKGLPESVGEPVPVGTWRAIQRGEGVQLVAHGHAIRLAQKVAIALEEEGIPCGIWGATTLHAFDDTAISAIEAQPVVAIIEEEAISGGLGETMAAHLMQRQARHPAILLCGVDGIVPSAHSLEGLEKQCGLDVETITARIREAWHGR